MPNYVSILCQPTIPNEIPIFFSTDDRYLPFLDVAIASLIDHASTAYRYRLIILNTGLPADRIATVLARQTDRVAIEFVDISAEIEAIQTSLKDVYHFSVVTYYRLFIASLFPQYDKIVYLDSDLILLGDVSELFCTDLEGGILAAAPEQYVRNTPNFACMHKRH